MQRILQLFRIAELRNKVITVAVLLVGYRLLAAVPIPGIDPVRLQSFFGSNQLLGLLDFFSGGGFSNLSVVMLGVGPYITATIIMQLLTIIFPKLKQLYYEEGERGRARFNRVCRLITVPLAIIQAYSFLRLFTVQGLIDAPSTLGLIANVAIITAGSMIALWLGELISEQKMGNGISLIIFAGIVAGIPTAAYTAWTTYTPDILIILGAVLLAVIFGIVYLTEGERRIPVTYARQVRGNKLYGGASTYLPLKVNQAGMIPLIFAISVILFPQFLTQVVGLLSPAAGLALNDWVTAFLNNHLAYGVVYFLLVFAFTYFYTSITFNPEEIAKNLQRGGGFIPGIRPGPATEAAFGRYLNRITLVGAAALGLVAVLPIILYAILAQFSSAVASSSSSSLPLSGTALLIVVAVALETMRQIDSQLSLRDYEAVR